MSTIRWLSVAEVAERLGIKGDTVYTWIQTRGLPGHRLGRIWRLDPEEVDLWIRTGQAATREPTTVTTGSPKAPKRTPSAKTPSKRTSR